MKGKEIPAEVWWAAPFVLYGVPCGTTVAEKCRKIIAKHPEHFPWESKYYSIPEEVHKAYQKEMGHDWDSIVKEIPMFVEKGDGIMKSIADASLSEEEYKKRCENPDKAIRDFFEGIAKIEEENRTAVFHRKKVWDKHYKKYGLEFKPDYHERQYYR